MKGQAGNMVLMLVVVVLGIYLIVNYSMPTAAVFGGFCSLDPSHSHDNNFIYAVYPEYSIDGCTYYTTVPNHGSSDRDRSLATMKTLGWEYLSCINYQQYSETTHFYKCASGCVKSTTEDKCVSGGVIVDEPDYGADDPNQPDILEPIRRWSLSDIPIIGPFLAWLFNIFS